MDPFSIATAGIGALGSFYKIAHGIRQSNLANKVVVPDADYQKTGLVPMATQMFNGRMPGATIAENNIMANQGSAMASTERNATSGTQALALLGAIQGQTNNAFVGLGQQEANYKLNTFNNLERITTRENEMDYADEVRKRQEAIAEKTALRGSGNQNVAGGINDATSIAYLLSQMPKK